LIGIYDFNNESEQARWIATAFKPHALAMLDYWQANDAKVIGAVKAKEKRARIIEMAKTIFNERKQK
jgi:hypothetical protein